MGNCCDSREGNKGEIFIRKVLFIESEKFHHFKLINDLKYKIENDFVQKSIFLNFLNDFLKNKEEYQAKIFKEIFQKYFEKLNVYELNIYEVSLLLIPYYKMSIEEKKALFKLIVDYLSIASSFISKPKCHREIVYNYYYFHTLWTNKIVIANLTQCSDKFQSKYSDIINDLFLYEKIFNEDNLDKEVDKVFKTKNDMDGYECSDVSSFEISNEKSRNTELLKNKNSNFKVNQISSYKRSNSSGSYKIHKNNKSLSKNDSPGKCSKIKKIYKELKYNEAEILVDLAEIRENFILNYSNLNN